MFRVQGLGFRVFRLQGPGFRRAPASLCLLMYFLVSGVQGARVCVETLNPKH